MVSLPLHKKIILFDGVCNLCNSSVLRIIKNDVKNIFVFASLQSEIGKKLCITYSIDTTVIDSIILIEPTKDFYTKSTAILKIIHHFPIQWKIVKIGWVFPPFVRNAIYDFIAKNRYNWFGKKNQCMIPTPELKSKFID